MKYLNATFHWIYKLSILLLLCPTLLPKFAFCQAEQDYSSSIIIGDKSELLEIGNTFIGYFTERKFDNLAFLFSDDISFRALLPPALVTSDNPIESANHFKTWFHLDDGDEYKVLESNAELMVDCLHIFYVIDVTKAKQVYRAEQHLFCEVTDGKINKLSLLCSGPRKVNQ